jgi:toxin secretion/phage lysis holin
MHEEQMKEIWAQSNYYFSQIWNGWMLKVPLSTVAGFYTGHLGGDWVLLLVFSAMIFVDLVFGTWLAIKRKLFDVRLFGRWVVKVGTHFFVIFVVGLAIRSILEPLSIDFPLLDLFLGMLICTEALSILKNMQRLGLPVPKLATRILADIQDKAEQKATDFFNQPENDRRKSPREETGRDAGGKSCDGQH